jgi:prolyl oligopeptidase
MKILMIAMAVLMTSTGSEAAGLPETAREMVIDRYGEVELGDPYRWLEGSGAPELEGKKDAALDGRVGTWTDAQNAYTRSVLEQLPGRKDLEAKLRPLMQVGSVSAPAVRLNRYFYSRREGAQAQPVIFVREGHGGEPRMLLDANEIDATGLTAPAFFAPSPDGELMAFGLYYAGDENTTLYVLRVSDGTWLADEIPGKVGSVYWTPDSEGFFYSRLADVDNPYSRRIQYHVLGTHHRQDQVLFEQYTEGPLATTWGPFAIVSRDARWMVLGYWTGTSSNDLWAIDLERWFRSGEFVRVEIMTGEPARAMGEIVGDTFYMLTTLGAPNGRVVAVDLNDPSAANWKTVVAEREDATIEGISASRSFLVVDYLEDAANRLKVVPLDGSAVRSLQLPGLGSVGVAAELDRDEAFYTFTSFNEPLSIYRVDLRSGKSELWERPDVPVDPSTVEVRQVFYRSKDGTRVPMFLVHRKGLRIDGQRPTILYGYGGFNNAMTPSFSASLFQWFDEGGVYALANIRGGSEYGEAWHRAGMLENRQNVFDDFIAAAEWLIANGYTKPARLAVMGGSNGGLLTGAMLVQRPELFGAVISAVPLLDMLRYQHFLMARYWVPEYGTAENPEHFEFLRAYSPYHNLDPAKKLPAVLLTAGENDSRVHPLHARKMAALLQHAVADDEDAKPVLLWVDRSAGHGQGKPLELRVRDVADQRIFLMWQLGMLADRK